MLKRSIKRWTTLELDMIKMCTESAYTVTIGAPIHTSGYIALSSLTSLTLHGVYLFLNDIHIPSLRILQLKAAKIVDHPTFRHVEQLYLCYQTQDLNWEELESLQILHIRDLYSFLMPSTHTFRHLSTLILEMPFNLPPILESLSAVFNESRYLESLVMADRALSRVFDVLRKAPLFRARVVLLSSRNFRSHSSWSIWDWKQFSTASGTFTAFDISYATAIMKFLKERAMKADFLDTYMKSIWDEAKKREAA